MDGGYVWEEQVLATHLEGRARLAPESEPGQALRNRVLSAEQSKELIITLEPGTFLYQPTLITPPSFYEHYGLDPTAVSLRECRPDLIECYEEDGAPHLRVIDVKASPGVKLSHRIQATMYTLILDHALADWGGGVRHFGVGGMGGTSEGRGAGWNEGRSHLASEARIPM